MKEDSTGNPPSLSSISIRNEPQRRRNSVDFKKKKKPTQKVTLAGPIKNLLRHWRSPSNPVDWNKGALSVNTSLIGADEKEASQPTIITSNYSSNSSMRMTKVRLFISKKKGFLLFLNSRVVSSKKKDSSRTN